MERWERAEKLNLDPPADVFKILKDHDEGGKFTECELRCPGRACRTNQTDCQVCFLGWGGYIVYRNKYASRCSDFS